MEIAGAYAALANSGVRVAPNAIVGVMTGDGTVLDRKATALVAGRSRPTPCSSSTRSCRARPTRGTGAGARARGLTGVLAGKTGTTNDGRDAWFVGYSPRFLAVVWVGYDDNRGLNLSGTQAAVPIFADFSRFVPSQYFAEPFPGAVRHRDGRDRSGHRLLAAPGCPKTDDRGLHPGHGADVVLPDARRRPLGRDAVRRRPRGRS